MRALPLGLFFFLVLAKPPSPAARLLDRAEAAIKAGDLGKAARLVGAAKQAAGAVPEDLDRAVYTEAALEAYQGDLEGAAKVMVDYLPQVIQRRNDAWALWFHDNLIMIRTAQGNLMAALIECDALRPVAEQGTWTDPELDRMTQARLKELWHRAYLLRMYAEQQAGSSRKMALREAELARQGYVRLARPLGKFADSIAVLDAFFALHDHRAAAALEAARRVDVTRDDDVEDLYLLQMALDAGGDRQGAARVRQRMHGVPYVSHANPIMKRWLERDQQAEAGGPARFSPRHPAGAP